MSEIQFTTVDRILAGLHSELKGTDLNESDIIEWIGEALGFMELPQVQEQAVSFLKVGNYEADIPEYFKMVLQMARYIKHDEPIVDVFPELPEDLEENPNCNKVGSVMDWLLGELDLNHKPYFNMQWQYIPWTTSHYHKKYYRPIRLSNNTFFDSLVCKEKPLYVNSKCEDEYTIVGTSQKKFRFSFKEGIVALSHIKTAVDKESGYPLVPDQIRHITAIKYYIRWKIAEKLDWQGREGFGSKADKNMQLWLKYVKQANNYVKMPKSIDEFQNLLEQSHYLIPNHKKYYNYFGNLGKTENRRF